MNNIIHIENIHNFIFTFRGKQVMVDFDLAKLYKIETKNLNKAVTRNIDRFPGYFRFQLTQEEYDELLRFQNGTSNDNENRKSQNVTIENGRGGRRYLPYVFTEQGVSMLSAVLRSETAIKE